MKLILTTFCFPIYHIITAFFYIIFFGKYSVDASMSIYTTTPIKRNDRCNK